MANTRDFLRRLARPGPIIAVLITAVSVFFIVWRKSQENIDPLPLAWFIMAAAVFGAIANQPSRNDAIQQQGGSLVGYLLWKAGIAIVFAMFLHLVFMAGLLKGPLFPEFTEGQFKNMARFVQDIDPVTYADAAKSVVWSFVAGYSERFVPNLISQLANRANEDGLDRASGSDKSSDSGSSN